MKILVLSDSHSHLGFMRRSIKAVKPDALVHLGDYWEDAEKVHREFPQLRMYCVGGNCDRYQSMQRLPEVVYPKIGGVQFFLTHGHLFGAKMTTGPMETEARSMGAQVLLYGHTHHADCRQEGSMWVVNPGTCQADSIGSCALVEVENGEVRSCRILRKTDLEEMP